MKVMWSPEPGIQDWERAAATVASHHPSLAQVTPALSALDPVACHLVVPSGTVVFDETSPCRGFPMIVEGEVKVSRSSGDGRFLELYRVVPGELCLVSSACLFGHSVMTAHGITTRPTRILLIPPTVFEQWLDTAAFRNEVLGLFAARMTDLTCLVDAVAFHRLDSRLAAALLGRGQILNITHQSLADELGTVREIISRLLRRFEREGWIKNTREHIEISDSHALRHLASSLPV
jgi:CRP/FNR family transcriptional regulator, anaerobic regulatory protein